jgi:hypothetical protein
MPLAIAYQLQLIYYQRHGSKLIRRKKTDHAALATFLSYGR